MEAAGSFEIMSRELGDIEADIGIDGDLILKGRLRRSSIARTMPGQEREQLAAADAYLEHFLKEINTALNAMREQRLTELESELRELLRRAVEA
jgi:hypothetical protein